MTGIRSGGPVSIVKCTGATLRCTERYKLGLLRDAPDSIHGMYHGSRRYQGSGARASGSEPAALGSDA